MMDYLKSHICKIWSEITKVNKTIQEFLTKGIGTEAEPVECIFTKKIIIGDDNELLFIDTIKKIFSFELISNTTENTRVNNVEYLMSDTETDLAEFKFDYENNLEKEIEFFIKYNEPSIFINLIISVIFQSFLLGNTDINFQGANSQIRYFAINIYPITQIYKNIPYYTFPSTNYWSIVRINTEGDWVNHVKFFSLTPYIGQHQSNDTTKDHLANCNVSITSTLIKAEHPDIFSKKRDTIQILYTFNIIFATFFHDPKKKQYAVLLPNMIDTSTFSIIARFEKSLSFSSINFSKSIRCNTFSEYPFYIKKISDKSELAEPDFLSNKLKNYPVLLSNYSENKLNIENFIKIVQDYNKRYTPMKIFPYFYQSNNNKVVTNIYDLIDDNSEANALINDFNKNYYNSDRIIIRDSQGKLLYSKFIIIALNHVNSGISTTNNIQVYNVANQKSIKTYETSSELPYLSNDSSPSTFYEVPQEKGIYTFEIDTSVEWLEGVNEIAFFERICYPVAFQDKNEHKHSGPRYSSFKINSSFPDKNPSLHCSIEDVQKNNVYTIESNDSNFSLHLNYCKYSTLNFRVFYVV